jgi:hypothetical protein
MNKLQKQQTEKTLLTPEELAESTERIISYHEGNIRAAQQQFGYQFLCGVEFHRVKNGLKHGQWEPWMEKNLSKLPVPIADRTARLYMSFAERLISKSATIADLSEKPLQLTNGEIPEKEKKAILEAVQEFANGRSITALWEDLGVIKPPKKSPVDNHKLTAEEEAASEKENARDHFLSICTQIEQGLDIEIRAHMADADKKRLIELFVEAANTLRGDLKANRKGKTNALETRPQKQKNANASLSKVSKDEKKPSISAFVIRRDSNNTYHTATGGWAKSVSKAEKFQTREVALNLMKDRNCMGDGRHTVVPLPKEKLFKCLDCGRENFLKPIGHNCETGKTFSRERFVEL